MKTRPDQNDPPSERLIARFRPAPVRVAVGPLLFWVCTAAGLAFGSLTHARWGVDPAWWVLAASSLILLAFLRLVWEIASWFATRYELTDTHARASFGVFRRIHIEVPLRRIQNVVVLRRFRDRFVGIGSVGIATAGTDGVELWWIDVAEPQTLAEQLRHFTPSPLPPATPTHPEPSPQAQGHQARPIVIGLTGSIAAGKSTAASILRDMGCVVVDADADAKAALDLPEVRDSLVAWWGPTILTPEGRVDRAAVASRVFASPEERARLERLVHPIVRRKRADLVQAAASRGARVVVADVPLLFEAGVDKECDVTVYVDAPREIRESRAIRSRGWTPEEFARREASQWPVDRKKSLADEKIDNAGDQSALREQLTLLLDRVARRPGLSGPPSEPG
jgi:dephospho-CoA kinase